MKKQLKHLISTYFLKAGIWVMAMLLGISLIPILMKSISMLIIQNAIPVWLVTLYDIVGWLCAWLLLFSAIWKMDGHPRGNFHKGLWQSFSKGGLWLIAIALLSGSFYKLYLSYGSLLVITGSSVLYILGQVLVMLLICLLLSVFVFWLICLMADPQYNTTFIKAFGYWLRRPLLILGSVLSVSLLLYVIPLFYDFILKYLPGLSLSFLELAAGVVIISLIQWMVLQPFLVFMFHNACRYNTAIIKEQPVTGEFTGEVAKDEIPKIRKPLSVFIAIVIIIGSGIYSLISGYPLSTISAVKQDIQHYLSYGTLMGKAGDHATAAYYNKIAEARILAWQGAVLDKSDALNQAVSLAPSDEQVLLLAAVKNAGSLAILDQGILDGNHSQSWYLALLNNYANSTNLSDTQKQRRTELLRICILQGFYCRTSVMPEDLTLKQDTFAEMLDGFNEALFTGKHYSLLARVGEEGGITIQLVLDTLNMAEKYPSHIELQYLAMSYGSIYLEDNATHYSRTADAALRYDALYMEQNAKTASEDEMVKEKLTVAKSLMACGQLKTSADFMSDLSYKSNELAMLKASVLFSLKSYDKCLLAVSDLLKEMPDDPQALYLAAISALQLGETTNSINYAIRLAKLIEASDNKLEVERLLYPYLLRFTINDSTGGYTTEAYSTLKEDEMTLLKSNEFLYNYITAAHLWTIRNTESRMEALSLLDKVLVANGSLSRALYIKGAIYFELDKVEQALEFLNSSLSLDDEQPTVWYALANLYDKMEKYEESYAACQKVLDYLPSNNHNTDVYGVSIHASHLMDKLKPYVKGGN